MAVDGRLGEAELHATLIAEVPVGIVVCHYRDLRDFDSIVLDEVNPAAGAIARRDPASMLGQKLAQVFPAGIGRLSKDLEAALESGAKSVISEIIHAGGEIEERCFHVTLVLLPGSKLALLLEDVTEQKKTERALGELTTFLESIVENIPNMIFVKEAEQLRFERFNRAGEELLGQKREVLLGKSDYDFFPKAQADFFTGKDREVLRHGKLVDIPEEEIRTAAGTRWLHTKKIPILDDAGRPKYLLGISEDITARKLAEAELRRAHEDLEKRVEERTQELTKTYEQLRHAQKMEAVGRLAGGVAHDFNNLLSVILSYTEMMLDDTLPGDPLRVDIVEMNKAAQRAASLTGQLLAFSRQQVMEPRIVDLNEIIANMERMLRRVLGEDIELKVIADPELGRVKVDPHQIEQVMMNLVVNARDAMPEGGRLTIETKNVELDEARALALATGPHESMGRFFGSQVMIAVSDTGIGMDAATRARAFEPFFTTKDHGKGTGLGLSTVFGIVRQSGGSIALESESGKGTRFEIYLPRVEGELTPALSEAPAPATLEGEETVLLVEDEEQVRVLAKTLLKKLGYQVLEARNAGEAVLIHEAHDGKIDLLLTDVVMPQVSGRRLAERLIAERPEMKVLFMSGYTDSKLEKGALDGAAFLQKPLTPDLLARKVRETLDAEKV